MRQAGIRKTFQKVSRGLGDEGAGRNAVSVEIKTDDIGTGDSNDLRDEPGGCPLTGQVVSGVKAA
jgi:hypothetical protein